MKRLLLLFVCLFVAGCASDDIGPTTGTIIEIEGNKIVVQSEDATRTYTYAKANKYQIGQFVAVWANEEGNVKKMEQTKETFEQPPSSLNVTIGDVSLKLVRGGFDWSYTDEKGQQVNVVTDHDAPPAYIDLTSSTKIDKTDSVQFQSVVTVENYSINIWDNQEAIATYTNLSDVKQSGVHILEFVVECEQGTVSYATAVDIQ